ncbi:hypothetical protein L7F22_001813 [Adiantum nelumboides]|nr:hypothetical protein [Adiantum nelumboides]
MEPSWRPLFFTCILLQAMLFSSFVRSQKPGFLSIDCGSDSASIYTDGNGIEWVSDSNLINEGTSKQVTGGDDPLLATIRLFDGNQSKYCYSLTNSAVEAGAFFLVRVAIWPGITPPYTPKDSDGYIRFKLVVDANEWTEVTVSFGSTTWWTSDMYTRAQRNSIDVCFARSTPDGDAPFVSALELRPLPSTLTSTYAMNGTNTVFSCLGHYDYGVLASSNVSFTRYPFDSLDRYWISSKTSAVNEVNTTTSAIDVSRQKDDPPSRILQNSYVGTPWFTISFSTLNPKSPYGFVFYFAEIEPAVNASGLRTFNIYANGELKNTEGEIDVFAQVGAYRAYGYGVAIAPNSTGHITLNFTSSATSVFPPFIAAAEIFEAKVLTPLTSASTVIAIEDIKSSLGLSSFRGDPCLPVGYGYNWLNCSGDSEIMAILLSKYGTGGEIPAAINSLSTPTEIYLDGNDLQGQIPDMSGLLNLKTLDLSNNRLSGSIPDSLASLKDLKALYLQNNNFSGEIPPALLQRKQASLLTFDFSGNPLCERNSVECGSPSGPKSSPPSSPTSSTSKKSSMTAVVGGAVAGILVVAFFICIAVYFCYKKKRLVQKDPKVVVHGASPEPESRSPVLNKVMPKLSVQEFTFQEIKMATDNFRTILGQGGFGPVYKGCLQDGRFVAIKVASNSANQGRKEFLNEVDLLSRVHHKNLVGLLGFCNEEKLVLVYEFMSNGSLFDCLHGPYARASPLSWRTRLRILVDAAQGFDYLHNGCNPRIIHRDVKSSNILLNNKMEAKISDFGISRDYIRSETGALPTTLMGSMGYMDPEYISSMKLTEKVDVYSFGVLLFEVVCGRTAIFKDSSQEPKNIVEWATASIDRGVIDEIADVSLHGRYDTQSVWKVVEVAMACVAMPSSNRPQMSEIYLDLREAERMEVESDEGNAIDQPSVDFTGNSNYSTMSYTQVSAR